MHGRRIFIASSTENLSFTKEVADELRKFATVDHWKDHFSMRPGWTYLQVLQDAVRSFDYAVFVMLGDDRARVRGEPRLLVRDNVIFELGLFATRLGMRKCFILLDRRTHKLSDIEGVNTIYVDTKKPENERIDEIGTVIRSVVEHEPDPRLAINNATEQAIHHVLRVLLERFCSANRKQEELRALCHLFDSARERLVTLTYVGRDAFDRDVDVPCPRQTHERTWWIIQRAFWKGDWECEDINWGSREAREDADATFLKASMKCVFAFPIRLATPGSPVLGTIDVNSTATARVLGWPRSGDRSQLKPKSAALVECGREAAAAIYHILQSNVPTG